MANTPTAAMPSVGHWTERGRSPKTSTPNRTLTVGMTKQPSEALIV
jgi:hypothetical protein